MLQQFSLANFKSFSVATLPLAELTVLIGANASGKSNLIEGLQLLSWLSRGRRLHDLSRTSEMKELSIRGLDHEFFRQSDQPFHFSVEVAGPVEFGQVVHEVSIGHRAGQPGLCVVHEKLTARGLESNGGLLYEAKPVDETPGTLLVSYNNFSKGRNKPGIHAVDQQLVFTQLTTPARFEAKHTESQRIIPEVANLVLAALEDIRLLDPNPATMRSYINKSDTDLLSSGSNVSAVLYSLCKTLGGKNEVLQFVRALPEQNIIDISFIETSRNDVMLQLIESFGSRESVRDAALLSDGTLRVLAIAAALLSARAGSLIIIEEIDNGVHPSRAQQLVDHIQRVVRDRNLRVLLTTHNPALMNALSPKSLGATVVCYRGPDGASSIVRLSDLARYPELTAQGQLGDIATRGILEKFVKQPAKQYDAGAFRELLKVSEGT